MLNPIIKIEPVDWMTASATKTVLAALSNGKNDAPAAMFVGGCVRNTLLGLESGDIDIATILTPDEVMQRLSAVGLKAIPTGIDHGTVTAVAEGRGFEITTLRRDVETDGRRAVVAFTKDWREDAQRRDFTMNTLLADMSGNIYDPTGSGVADLRAGRVVFVGDAAQRIAEDYLRILRFFRFHAWYGKGSPDPAGLAACAAAAGNISKLSRERVTHEILRLLGADRAAENIDLMFVNGILSQLKTSDFKASQLAGLINRQAEYALPDIVARLYIIAGCRDIEGMLILSGAQKKQICALNDAVTHLDNHAVTRARIAAYRFGRAIALQACLIRNANQDVVQDLKSWAIPTLPVNGNDLIAAGMAPGTAMGTTLRRIEDWWIANDFIPDRAACIAQILRP